MQWERAKSQNSLIILGLAPN